jgi:hypothetical protein
MHLLVRVPRYMRVQGRAFDVIEEHNAAFRANGKVAVAKFGTPFSRVVFGAITQAIRANAATLYLVTKEDDEFFAWAGRIVSIGTFSGAESGLVDLFPEYYRSLLNAPTSYLCLGSELREASLRGLMLASNTRPVLDVMRECRTAMMLVQATGRPGKAA